MPADLSLSIATRETDVFTAGIDYQLASYETSSEADMLAAGNDATATAFGLYAQQEMRLSRVILRAGARYNIISHDINLLQGVPPGDDSNSWNKLLYSAGGRYNHSDALSVYTNWGTSFKAPSLKSVGGTIPLDSEDSGHLPNPDIRPESGLSLDLGVNYRPMEGVQLGLRGFNIEIDDQIVQRVVPVEPDDPAQSQDINAGNTTTRGAELEVTHRLSEMVEWFANYTYTNAEVNEHLDESKVGAKINFVPESAIGAGVHLTFPQGLRATVTVQSYSGIYQDINKNAESLDGYILLNARLEQRVRTQDGYDLHLYLEPYNITDQTFEMPVAVSGSRLLDQRRPNGQFLVFAVVCRFATVLRIGAAAAKCQQIIVLSLLFSLLLLAGAPALAEGVAATDFRGRRIELDKPAERIVCLLESALSGLYMLGADTRLVGISTNIYQESVFPYYAAMDERIRERTLPTPGNWDFVNIESMVALRPDLVIIWSGQEESIAALEEKGIPVFGVFIEHFADIHREIIALGELTGTPGAGC